MKYYVIYLRFKRLAVYEILFLTFVCYKDSNLLNLIYVVYSFHHDDNYIFMP